MSRRKYSPEFKDSAVKLVSDRGYTVVEAAKSLGVDANSVRGWLKKFPAESKAAIGSENALKAEIRQLREENKRLLLEREILKKATAFFAKHQS